MPTRLIDSAFEAPQARFEKAKKVDAIFATYSNIWIFRISAFFDPIFSMV